MHLFLKGVLLGCIIVLPGMSGGTVFVIFGIYENLIKDIVKLNIKPYIPLLIGAVLGIFIGAYTVAVFFESYRDGAVALLLGFLLASIKSVLKNCPKLTVRRWIALSVGFLIGFYLVGEPINFVTAGENVSFITLFIGGAVASAAMIIPGIPGSSVLIIMGIYDSLLLFITELRLLELGVFGVGGVLGIVTLVKLLERLYEKYRGTLSYSFAGLILGSGRALKPFHVDVWVVMAFVVGFLVVWLWSGKE